MSRWKIRFSYCFVLLLIVLINPGNLASADQFIITPWDACSWNYKARRVPADLYVDPSSSTGCNAYDLVIETIDHYSEVVDMGYVMALTMTPGIREEVEEVLINIYNQQMVTEELINLVKVYPCQGTRDIWRMGNAVFQDSKIIMLSFIVEGTKMFMVASPSDGLIEGRAIVDYGGDIVGFNEIAHRYFNLSGEQQAVEEYRPIRIGIAHCGGWICPRPECDYAWDGFIIDVVEQNRTGIVRSTERLYFNNQDWGTSGTYCSIEFSLSYTQPE